MGSSGGTRVRLFPQPFFLDGYVEPVTVEFAAPAGSVRAGPEDERMYAVRPLGKSLPYGLSASCGRRPVWVLPPWRGPAVAPALPDRLGHFDHLAPEDPAFLAAHAWGCARFVLQVWERYCGPIPWHFGHQFPKLEIACIDGYDNAQAGFGYLELGQNLRWRGRTHSFALNFDTIAHEMGHLILFALVGIPQAGEPRGEYRGFHEAMADIVALIASAHFDAVLDGVLEATYGNLYVANELSRFSELSASEQIREAANSVRLDEFAQGWADEHDLSLPLTGALFDILVEVFQGLLVERGLVPAWILDLGDNLERMQAFQHAIDAAFEQAYRAAPLAFKAALIDARDILGLYMAGLWPGLRADTLTYAQVAQRMRLVERRVTGGRFARAVETSFAWRGIGRVGVGPRLAWPTRSHTDSARTFVPPLRTAGGRIGVAGRIAG